MLEIIVVGFAILMLVVPLIAATAKLTDARADVNHRAREVASWVARHGVEPSVGSDDVVVTVQEGHVHAIANERVELVGVGGATLAMTVRAEVDVPISPYRSRR